MKFLTGAIATAAVFYLICTYWQRNLVPRPIRQAEVKTLPYGRPGLHLIHFYASPAVLTEGEQATVCYGVENARSVAIDPPVQDLTPSFNRCFSIAPTTTTTYHFTAVGEKGERATAQFTLPVKPAPPFIFMFTTSEKKIRRGEKFTICYGVRYAGKVRLDPVGMNLPASPKNCIMLWPAVSMKLTLTATGAEGMTDKFSTQVEVAQRL